MYYFQFLKDPFLEVPDIEEEDDHVMEGEVHQ
jgi:hypothetical protein